MKRILFPLLYLLCVVFFFTVANGEDVESLRGSTDIPADSNSVVEMDWQPPWTAVARTFAHQPPLIPHDIKDMTISAYQNTCLGCHGMKGSGAPKPFHTHYIDRDGNTGESISKRWYFCTQCHIGQVAVKPLVENTFEGK